MVKCKLVHNGMVVSSSGLADTGAGGYVFIRRSFALQLSRRLSIPIERTKDSVKLHGYDGKESEEIREVFTCTLGVGGRRIRDTPMVVVDMQYDIILGREWFAQQDVLIDCKRRRLIWPDKRKEYIAMHELEIQRKDLPDDTPDPRHQQDADRRDQAMAKQIRILQRPRPGKETYRQQHREALSRMNRELLKGEEDSGSVENTALKKTPLDREKSRKIYSIDIALIGGTGFHLGMKRKENEFFMTSLYEIDRIIDEKTNPQSDGPEEIETEEDMLRRTVPQEFHDLIRAFSKKESNKLPPHRVYDHKIELEKDVPIGYHPLYHQTVEELQTLKEYLRENLDKGFIEHSSAPFASPILFVKKPSGGLRFCIDYRKLNEITKKDRYPLPLLDETLARISRAKIFTKLDIRQAFHRIRIDPASEELTTFRTRYGQYKCKVLPFGLTNGPATYQRYMNDVLFEYLDDFCTAYLDDILIYSEDPTEHALHVRKVLQKLQDAGLQVDIKKCEFGVTKTKYLGFIVSTAGIEVDPEKVAAIKNWQFPKSVKGVQAFLGFCNFYRRFIEGYGRIARPLNLCTRKDRVFEFDDSCKEAFTKLQEALTTAPILVHYHPERESMLETDSSDGTVAGVLSQKQPDGLWRPVAYFSKSMLPAECNYTIHDKEMLAIIRAFEEWRAELEGLAEPLKVYSDHKALEYFMTKKSLSARQARWAELLSRYHFKIQYHSATKNQKADALTRREEDVRQQDIVKKESREQVVLPAKNLSPQVQEELARSGPQLTVLDFPSPTVLDFPSPAREMDHVKEAPARPESILITDRIFQANRTNEELQELRDQAGTEGEKTYTLKDGMLFAEGRLVVPDQDNLRTLIIREIHGQKSTAHPGQKKTLRILRDRYHWKGMASDVDQYIRNCHTCRRSHVPRDKTPGLLHPLPIPSRPWQHISMDFKSFPASKRGFDAILVVVDRLGKRPISVPCHKTTTAKDLATLFINHVWRYYGPPDSIVSDRGPQFISSFWKEFCNILGVKVKLSTAEQPQTDGQTEIVNQYIDQRLRPFVNYYQDNWDKLLPIVDFAQASLPHEAIGQSSFQTEMAFEPRTSFDWREIQDTASASERLNRQEAQAYSRRIQEAWEFARSDMKLAQERYCKQANKHRRPVDFGVKDKVWVSTKGWRTERPSKKLDYQQAGPYEIIGKEGHSFRLKLPPNIKVHPVFHASKLRKDPDDPLPGQRPEEGLPIIVEGSQEWEIEKILGVRVVRKQLRYRVQWVGFDDDPDEYLPEDLNHAPMALRDFHDAYPEKPGPPKNLEYWLDCAIKDIWPEKRRNDNAA